jgi:undecaprenyl-phosphate galactose phosphotransferase/putative colanic acid biosynthesis UDP-glucose lipid carrier transferase
LPVPVASIGFLVAVGDLVTIEIAALASAVAYHRLFLLTNADLERYAIVAALCFVNFASIQVARGSYSFKSLLDRRAGSRDVATTWSVVILVMLSLFFALKVGASVSRGAIFLFTPVALCGLLAWRARLKTWLPSARESGAINCKRAIVVAERDELRQLSLPRLVEFSDFDVLATQTFDRGAEGSIRHAADDAILAARTADADMIVLLANWGDEAAIDRLVALLRILPLPVYLLPDRRAARRLRAAGARQRVHYELITLQRAPLLLVERAVKRLFDLAAAFVGLVVLSPLLVFVALLVKLESDGPALFRQERSGFDGRPFSILKFRTMTVSENGDDVRQAMRNDPRVTRLGAWLRRTSIDELPQLWNVLRGEMSIVGPRPHAVAHTKQYEQQIGEYAFRHHVKPGLTGWAQVHGLRGATQTLDLMQRRVEHDLYYIGHWSLLLDVSIVLRTVRVALRDPAAF